MPRLWDMFSEEDKALLARNGFSSDMSIQDWGSAINGHKRNEKPKRYATTENGDFVFLRELGSTLNNQGLVGNPNSYHLMPQFIATVLDRNRFIFDEKDLSRDAENIPWEIGSAHTHPVGDELDALQKALTPIVGEDMVRRTPSIPDISLMRGSTFENDQIARTFLGKRMVVQEIFMAIVTVNQDGHVTGSRYFDLEDCDLKTFAELNDKAAATLDSSKPDYEIIADHYRYIDSIAKDDFGTPDSSPLIGDSDYDRAAEESESR